MLMRESASSAVKPFVAEAIPQTAVLLFFVPERSRTAQSCRFLASPFPPAFPNVLAFFPVGDTVRFSVFRTRTRTRTLAPHAPGDVLARCAFCNALFPRSRNKTRRFCSDQGRSLAAPSRCPAGPQSPASVAPPPLPAGPGCACPRRHAWRWRSTDTAAGCCWGEDGDLDRCALERSEHRRRVRPARTRRLHWKNESAAGPVWYPLLASLTCCAPAAAPRSPTAHSGSQSPQALGRDRSRTGQERSCAAQPRVAGGRALLSSAGKGRANDCRPPDHR